MQSIFNIMKVYNLYFRKQILRSGILDNKMFRLYIGLMAALVYGVTFWVLTSLFNTATQKEIDVILHIYTTTVVIWSLVIFCGIRFLFMISKDFKNVVMYFPITQKEQTIASRLLEFIVGFSLVLILVSAFFLSLTLKHITYIDKVLVVTVITGAGSYAIVSLIYYITAYLLSKVPLLNNFSEYMSLVIISAISSNIIVFSESAIMAIVDGYYSEKVPINLFNSGLWLYEHGYVIFVILVIVLLYSLLLFTIILLPETDMHVKKGTFKLLNLKSATLLDVYFLTFIRNNKFITNISFAITLFALSLYFKTPVVYAIGSFFILSIQGLSHFEDTNSIREIVFRCGWKYSAFKDYIALCASQIAAMLIVIIGPIIWAILTQNLTIESVYTLLTIPLIVIAITIVTVTLGIMFPAKNSNPFSPLISIAVTMIIGICLLILLFFLQLSGRDTALLLSCIIVITAFIGITGLNNNYGGITHEKSN